VRDLLGLSDPEDGESVLGGQAAGSAGASSNPLSAMLGQGNESEGDEPEPEAPKVAAVRKRKR
jgi:hypothetical protein